MRWKRLLFLFGILAAVALGSAAAAFFHSERLDAVTVRFTGPGAEAEDVRILGLGKDHVKPDYRLDLVRERGTSSCATIHDTSAAGGIRFDIRGAIPLSEVRELVLVEDDTVTDDDPVARVAFAPPTMSSQGYVFEVASSRSFGIGLSWFLGTPLGLPVALLLALFALWLLGALARAAVSGGTPPSPDAPGIDLPDIGPPDLC